MQYKTLLTGLYSYIIIININKKKRRAIRSSCPKWSWQPLSNWHLLILSFFSVRSQTSSPNISPAVHPWKYLPFVCNVRVPGRTGLQRSSFIMMNIYWVNFNYFILAKFTTLPVLLACHKFLPTFQTVESTKT